MPRMTDYMRLDSAVKDLKIALASDRGEAVIAAIVASMQRRWSRGRPSACRPCRENMWPEGQDIDGCEMVDICRAVRAHLEAKAETGEGDVVEVACQDPILGHCKACKNPIYASEMVHGWPERKPDREPASSECGTCDPYLKGRSDEYLNQATADCEPCGTCGGKRRVVCPDLGSDGEHCRTSEAIEGCIMADTDEFGCTVPCPECEPDKGDGGSVERDVATWNYQQFEKMKQEADRLRGELDDWRNGRRAMYCDECGHSEEMAAEICRTCADELAKEQKEQAERERDEARGDTLKLYGDESTDACNAITAEMDHIENEEGE
jgi:hypothetical protein